DVPISISVNRNFLSLVQLLGLGGSKAPPPKVLGQNLGSILHVSPVNADKGAVVWPAFLAAYSRATVTAPIWKDPELIVTLVPPKSTRLPTVILDMVFAHSTKTHLHRPPVGHRGSRWIELEFSPLAVNPQPLPPDKAG